MMRYASATAKTTAVAIASRELNSAVRDRSGLRAPELCETAENLSRQVALQTYNLDQMPYTARQISTDRRLTFDSSEIFRRDLGAAVWMA